MDDYVVISKRVLTGTMADLPYSARLAWQAVLFEAEKLDGKVKLPVRDLARLASITIKEAADALRIFQEPDMYSNSKISDGRRLLPVDGEENWYTLATWDKHQAEKEKYFSRLRQQRWRDRKRPDDDAGNGASRRVTVRHAASRRVTNEPEPEPEPEEKGARDTAGARSSASTPDWTETASLVAAIDASRLKRKPTEQIVGAWQAEYGSELILETLADTETSYAGKTWQYLEKILTNRKENPNERPANRRRGAAADRSATQRKVDANQAPRREQNRFHQRTAAEVLVDHESRVHPVPEKLAGEPADPVRRV